MGGTFGLVAMAGCVGGLQDAETRWLQREDTLRREVALLEERLRGLELDKGDLLAASSDSTRPLLKWVASCSPSGIRRR